MDIKVVVGVVLLFGLATGDPGLRKVPRIYNAYVTANEKLEPSHASPHAVPVVPVFQANPVDVQEPLPEQPGTPEPAIGKNGERIMPSAKQGGYPLTFYPQSVGYYPQPQPYIQYPYFQPQYGNPSVVGFPGSQNVVYQGAGYQAGGSEIYPSPGMSAVMQTAASNSQPTSFKSSNSATVEMNTGVGNSPEDNEEYYYEYDY